jgi:hypothetical protein
MRKIWNNEIACEPFLEDYAQGTKGPITMVKNRHELVPLKVLVGNDKIEPGQVVYVRGSDSSGYGKSVWHFQGEEDRKFILVPEGSIVAVQGERV